MTLRTIYPLLITFDDIINIADSIAPELEDFSESRKDFVLQRVHNFLVLPGDAGHSVNFKDGTSGPSPGSSQFFHMSTEFKTFKTEELQVYCGAWRAAFMIDTPAGTGSLSGVSIDAFNVTNTMAKNNSTADDLMNANQYGTALYELLSERVNIHMFIA